MNDVFSPSVVMLWVCLMLCGTGPVLWLSTNQTGKSKIINPHRIGVTQMNTLDYERLCLKQGCYCGLKFPSSTVAWHNLFVTKQSSSPPLVTKQSSSPALVTEQSSSPALVTKQSSSPPLVAKQSSSPPLVTKQSSSPPLVAKQSSSPPLVTSSHPVHHL